MLTAGELLTVICLAIESGVFETAPPLELLMFSTWVTRKLLVREEAMPESNEDERFELLFSDVFWRELLQFSGLFRHFSASLAKDDESLFKDEVFCLVLDITLFEDEADFLTGNGIFVFFFGVGMAEAEDDIFTGFGPENFDIFEFF